MKELKQPRNLTKSLTETKKSLEQQSINKTYEIRENNLWTFQNLRSIEVDYNLFNTQGALKYHKEPSLYGGSGARDLYFEFCNLAYQTKGNAIAVRREYLMATLERVHRTINNNLDILEEMQLIKVIKNKKGFFYIALKDYREAMKDTRSYEFDLLNRGLKPLPYYKEAFKILQKLTNTYIGKKFRIKGEFAHNTENKLFKLRASSVSRMKAFNDILLEFSPIDDLNTTYTFSYAQITNTQPPSFEAVYRRGIIEKRLNQALSRRCLEINKNFIGGVA